MAKTNVAILGAGGRMGGALIRGLAKQPELTLSAAVERAGHPAVGQDAGIIAGIAPLGVAVSADRDAAISGAHTVIDFTFHAEVPASVAKAVAAGARYVLGTTGLDESERAAVEAAARRIPIVWAPNMSTGVNVLLDLVRRAAAVLGLDYDAEIVEIHHKHKLDAPSGTALGLGRAVAQGRGQELDTVARHGREGIVGERPRGEIGFHAVRGGDVVGDHTVVFATDGERVELTHKASSRDCLAGGALKAALWLRDRQPGLYAMADVLGL